MKFIFYKLRWFFAMTLGPARLYRLFFWERTKPQEALSRRDFFLALISLSIFFFVCFVGFLSTSGEFFVSPGRLLGEYRPGYAAFFILMMFYIMFQLFRAMFRRAQDAGFPGLGSLFVLFFPIVTLQIMGAKAWDDSIGPPLGLMQIIWAIHLLLMPTDGWIVLWGKLKDKYHQRRNQNGTSEKEEQTAAPMSQKENTEDLK